ncbi:hypothetical protein VPH35_128472 [Triticum aestivum]
MPQAFRTIVSHAESYLGCWCLLGFRLSMTQKSISAAGHLLFGLKNHQVLLIYVWMLDGSCIFLSTSSRIIVLPRFQNQFNIDGIVNMKLNTELILSVFISFWKIIGL